MHLVRGRASSHKNRPFQQHSFICSLCIHRRDGLSRKGRQKDYTPSQWNEYFAEKRDVEIDDKHVFRLYLTKPDSKPNAPLVVLLHGGGYSALTWSHFTVSKYCARFGICKFIYFEERISLDGDHINDTLSMFGNGLARSWRFAR